MVAASSNRTMPVFWFIVAVFVVPFGLTFALMDTGQFQAGVLLAVFGLLVWLFAQGAGWQRAEKGVVVIRKGPGDELDAFWRRPQMLTNRELEQTHIGRPEGGLYLFVPGFHVVEATLPVYGFGFEVEVTDVDTQTPWLSKIGKIRVRASCRLLPDRYLDFYLKAHGWLDRIRHFEEHDKLSRTNIALWKKLLREISEQVIDDTVRDVIWLWSAHLQDEDLVAALTYKPEPPKKLDGDPYSLSRNRLQLQKLVADAIRVRALEHGFELSRLVFEKVDFDPEQIKKANRNKENELKEASHKALIEAEMIRQKGCAETEVRTDALAKLLKVLIVDYKIPHTDPLIAQVVRAALYSDGEMIWSATLDKGAGGDAKPR